METQPIGILDREQMVKRPPIPYPTLEEIHRGWERFEMETRAHVRSMPRDLYKLGDAQRPWFYKFRVWIFKHLKI